MSKRLDPFVVFDSEDVPSATPAEPEQLELPTPPQPGPWSSDLEEFFEDPAARARADEFMRSKVQPRMTQLETQIAERKPAYELYDALVGEESDATLAQVVSELRPDIADQFMSLLEPQEPITDEEPVHQQLELPPELQEMIEERTAAKEAEDYDNEIARVQALHPELVPTEFHPFVAGAEGDFDLALEHYKTWQQEVRQRYGGAPTPQPEPAPAPQALATSQTQAPPVQEKYESLDDAFDAFFAEQRGTGTSPVGVV